MARTNVLFISLLLLVFSVLEYVNSSKLNVPRVLLPIFNDFSTNFTLEVTEGSSCSCYKWTTSRSDIIQLIPLDVNVERDCSPRVIVSTLTKEPTRNTAIVLAEEVSCGQVLRCDVIVDVIDSLHLVTTTRELFMEEAPEAFEVRAYDNQGNQFTTLEGIEFDWMLSSSVLRYITFRDSPYEAPSSIETFEEMGKKGHIVLLEGVKTGSAKISVTLPYAEYKSKVMIEVSLMVVANLIIEPSEVYILQGDVVHFRLIQVKHGRLEEITLPSKQYSLIAENTNIGHIEKNSGYLTGMDIGRTNVYLHDVNMDIEEGLRFPKASVYVSTPARITLSLMPYNNWATVFGEKHDIVVELFASNDHKIHIGDNVQFDTVVDEKYFVVLNRSLNGNRITGQANEHGVTEVRTSLRPVASLKLGKVPMPKLTAKAQMSVFPRITLTPNQVVFPWDPTVKPKYEVDLEVNGGDGRFLWTSTNNSKGMVTQTGHVRTLSHGQFEICASLERNHHIRQCAKFYILPPTRLEIVEYIMETEVGSPIFLHVAAYGKKNINDDTDIPHSKCRDLPIKVKTSDHNFLQNKTAFVNPVGAACNSIAIVGLSAGSSRVTLSYTQGDITLEQSVTVAAYRPLELLYPHRAHTVLAVGSSRYLMFTGGPRPWPGRGSQHVVEVVSDNTNLVEAIDVTKKLKSSTEDSYVINVICKNYGEAKVTVTMYNLPIVPNCKYTKKSASATVICAKPRYLYLHPDVTSINQMGCPLELSAERIIVSSHRHIDLMVTAKNENGRKFDNISSLDLKWHIDQPELATVENKNSVFERTISDGNVLLPNKSYQVIIPRSKKGNLNVGVVINGYRSDVLKKNSVKSPSKPDAISAMVSLYMVDNTYVIPDKISIYNHPLNKQRVSVYQGSGFYEFELSNTHVAKVKYDELNRELEITPLKIGDVQITLKDLCLACEPVAVIVNVVHVSSMLVDMPDRVEIGKCIQAVVKFFDKYGNPMILPKLDYLDIRHSMENDIVNIKLATEDPKEPWSTGEVHYIVSGLELGKTSLIFASGRGDRELSTLAVDIQVFSPLRMFPQNTTLLVGARHQLRVQGGPQPEGSMEYTTEKDNIVQVSSNGVLRGLNVGHTKVTARSISVNSVTGNKVINSQDSVNVYVIPLNGVKIATPLTRFLQEATVPVWATGIPEQISPLILGSMDPPVLFSWGSHCDVVKVRGRLHTTGIKLDAYNQVSIRIKGLRPGHCTLQLNLTVPGITAGKKNKATVTFLTSIQIEVFEELKLTEPSAFSGTPILIAPYTKIQLKTNRDGLSQLTYKLHGDEHHEESKSVSVDKPIISVSQTGQIESYGMTGRAMVVITGTDRQGLQESLSIPIQVKQVHYMMLNVNAKWLIPSEQAVTVIPVGAEFELSASFHDNTGAKFTAAQNDLHFRTNRHDLADVLPGPEKKRIFVSSVNSGGTVMKVWTDTSYKTVDYVQITGRQTALPTLETVTSGDILCLWSPVVDKDSKSGSWSSDTSDILIVNQDMGIGQVVTSRSGQTHVQYDLAPAAKVLLNIEPISEVAFMLDNSVVLSNSPNVPYRVPFVLRDAKNPNKMNNLHMGYPCQHILGNEIKFFPYTCDIMFSNNKIFAKASDIFNVRTTFNKDTGLYSCELSSPSEISANTSILEANVSLVVVTNSGVKSEPLELQFVPAVYIPTTEMYLSDSSYSTTLTLTGLPQVLKQVTVVAFDPALIKVSEPHHISPTIVNYDIKLIDYHWKLEELRDPMSVIVHSKLTNQHQKIRLRVNGDMVKPFCPAGSGRGNFFYEHRQTLIVIISMLILFFITFYAYSHYIQPVINVNVSPNRSLLHSTTNMHQGDRTVIPYGMSNPGGGGGCTNTTCLYKQRNYGTGEQALMRSASPDYRRNRRFL